MTKHDIVLEMTEVLPLNTSPLPVRLRIEDYLLLDASGAFADYAKTELIDGEILYMNAQHRPHVRAKMDLYDAIRDAMRGDTRYRAFVEASISIPGHSAPEPDLVLTSEPDGEGLIPVHSIALVVEVSDTTLKNDLGVKATLYSAAGIPEYWVLDIEGRAIHQMWAPAGQTYSERRKIAFGQNITAATITNFTLSTTGL